VQLKSDNYANAKPDLSQGNGLCRRPPLMMVIDWRKKVANFLSHSTLDYCRSF
jgi:hypothetical protein